MIDQVLYRRKDQGYSEACSCGLSKDEAHRVIGFLDKAASDMTDLGSGMDAPYLLYPFIDMHRFCLAVFQREFSKGRSNSVDHGLLIKDTAYREMVKHPEQIWGFTNKNFISKKVNHRGEMFALKKLEFSENAELCKDYIFSEYGLDNDGFLKFLNALYTSLSKNKNYTFGLRIDNSKDTNRVMRHFGYLIMALLPFELREKISFCSRSTESSIGVTVQMLQEKDAEKTDITYDVLTGECKVNKVFAEIIDFCLRDLFKMSDAELREYFETLSLFAAEKTEDQLASMKDVCSLQTSETDTQAERLDKGYCSELTEQDSDILGQTSNKDTFDYEHCEMCKSSGEIDDSSYSDVNRYLFIQQIAAFVLLNWIWIIAVCMSIVSIGFMAVNAYRANKVQEIFLDEETETETEAENNIETDLMNPVHKYELKVDGNSVNIKLKNKVELFYFNFGDREGNTGD